MVAHGGDLALGGPHPAEVVDRVRQLGWPSVLGNTDVVLAGDDAILEPARGFVAPPAAVTRELLGPERVAWLTSRPMEWRGEGVALVHAVPGDCWPVVPSNAPDDRLRQTYGPLGVAIAVYGHIHHAYVRSLDGLTVLNSGSVSLPMDGDVRATYVVIEDGRAEQRRVEAELAVGPALWMAGTPLQPEQLQGHLPAPLQLPVHLPPVRLRPLLRRHHRRRRERRPGRRAAAT